MSASQKFFRKVWGVSGTRAAVPDDVQADGTVAYESGYGFDYQRATGDSLLKLIERDKFNQLLYDVTLSLQQYQTSGFPEFIAAADNGGVAYSYRKNAYVYWPTDGNIYLSLVNANTSDPTDNTKWRLFNPGSDVGVILPFPFTAPPAGFLKANGALLSRATYPSLWAAAQASGNLAVSDGVWTKGQFSPGDGATTFRIPDARGYHPRYWDDGAGVDSGRLIGSLQADQLLSHNHGVNDPSHNHAHSDPGHSHGVNDPGHNHVVFNGLTGGDPSDPYNIGNGSDGTLNNNKTSGSSGTGIWLSGSGTGVTNVAATTGITTQTTGSTENRVKTVAWLACIKYQ